MNIPAELKEEVHELEGVILPSQPTEIPSYEEALRRKTVVRRNEMLSSAIFTLATQVL